ncbi:chloride conductance regulatory protein icln [Holotrichia oblita]|uniref:Chloride conductance regulatory protein icln n=1 Tax=Holotrichia oblita TaxID=644536 RepID=A0ACB9TSV6_HOLOL|nr:chloride conductance regulatory protein icln [Holotrichia oblita]
MVVLTSFVYPESPIRFEARNTKAVLDKKDLGVGTLYISESAVCWKTQDNVDSGFSLSYHHISLHATSTDPNVYPKECIYIMIDTHVTMPGDKNEDETADMSDSDIESEADISELILVPDDSNTLHTMYEALKQCQALNPDPDDMISDEDDVYEDCDEGIEERNIIQNEINESRAESDTVENLTTRMQGNTMNIGYDSVNGDQNDEEFEDAD